jgi:type VI secretion system secreted protein Hcp
MAVDMFLKLTEIDGESRDDQYAKWIEIESFSWGESQEIVAGAAGAGAGSGKVSMQDFHFTTGFSKASVKLFVACASGEHIPDATLNLRRAGGDKGGETYLTWKLRDVKITSYQTGASSGGSDVPMDQFSLNFTKVEVSYKEQKADGGTGQVYEAGWDLQKNVKL